MGNDVTKKNKNKSAGPTTNVDPIDALYANDPAMHKDANGAWIYTPSQQSSAPNKQQKEEEQPTYIDKLYNLSSKAVSEANAAKTAYDTAYTELGDAYKAIAETMKPKDRTEEQKRLRNVGLAQAIGQGLSAIFGGIYANSKKGRGKIVMPEDFASKTLAKAEELREKGILEEKEFSKILSDMNLRKAELNAKKASEDYTAKKVAADKAQAAIADYLKELDTRAYKSSEAQKDRDAADKRATSAQEFQAAQTKSSQEFQAAEAEKTRQSNLQIRQQDALEKAKGIFAGVDDATISMTMGFLPKTRSEARKRTGEGGIMEYYYETVPAQSWTEEEYKSALNQARAYINGIKGKIGDANIQELAKSNSLVEIDELLKDLSQSENQKYDWNYVANLLKNGVRVNELAPFLSAKSKNNSK